MDETTSTQQPGAGDALARIADVARRADRRLRADRAFRWSVRAAAVGVVVALVAVVLRKTGLVSETAARATLGAIALSVVAAALVAFARRLPRASGAIALDRHYGLADRLSSALAFASLPADEQTPFMHAAMEDASARASAVDPRAAVPLRRPRELPFVLGMAALLAGVALFEIRTHVTEVQAKTIDAVDVTDDDLDAMREFLKQVDQRLETDEAKAALQEFNQLIEDLAQKRLDRTEAFRRMQALEDRLLEGNAADKKAFEDSLAKMGEELKKSELSKPAGEALSDKNLAAAERAFRDLAKKLREQGKGTDKQELEKLRAALNKSAEEAKKRAEALDKRRDELKEQLLQQRKKAGDAGAMNEEEQSLLKKRERELERLDREREQQERAGRQLDRLDRELQKAAEDLMKDLGLSASDLDSAAEDINRMARQEMSQDEKEQLRKKLEELRETLRQQGQGGKGQIKRLREFQQRAQGRGGQGQRGQGQPGQGEQGEGEQGEGQQGQGQGQQGQGQQGQGAQAGAGQKGQGQGGQGQSGQGGETWILGPNGEKLLMLSKGQGQGQGQGGQGGQGQGGQGDTPGGQGAGSGHDGNVQGKQASNLGGQTQDTQVSGTETGQGASRSEVILGAAERGFASRGYQKVFREYHNVAEEALERDEIPGGYRFYVRRYFQLIRPREDVGADANANKGTDKP